MGDTSDDSGSDSESEQTYINNGSRKSGDNFLKCAKKTDVLLTLFNVLNGNYDSIQITKLLNFIASNGDETVIPILQKLIDLGCSLNQGSSKFLTILCQRNKPPIKLIEFVIRSTNQVDSSVLFDFIYDNVTCLELLINFDHDPIIYNRDGFTPIHFYVKHGWPKCVEFLLKHGVSPRITALNGDEPLNCICDFDPADERMVSLLLEYGAELHTPNPNGITSPEKWHYISSDLIDIFLGNNGPSWDTSNPPTCIMHSICGIHPLNLSQFSKAIEYGLCPTSNDLRVLHFNEARQVFHILIEKNLFQPQQLVSECTNMSIMYLISHPEMTPNFNMSTDAHIIEVIRTILATLDDLKSTDERVSVSTLLYDLLISPQGLRFISTNQGFKQSALDKVKQLSLECEQFKKYIQHFE